MYFLTCFDPSGEICTFWCLPRPSRALFSCRDSWTAVDTRIASNYVKLPPPLISYRHCYPVNPFRVQSCKEGREGSQGSALGKEWLKIHQKSSPALGVCGLRCVRPPVPHGTSAGHGNSPKDTGVPGACKALPGESRAGTKVVRLCSK